MRLKPFCAALLGIGSTLLGPPMTLAQGETPPGPSPPGEMAKFDCGASPVRAIYFDFDRHDIRADRIPDLESVAAWMSACPSVRVRLEGHTDDQYTEKHAMAVSQKLAGSVRDFLVKKGIREERMETIGWGKYQPAVPGKSEESRIRNRRVEIQVCMPACAGKRVRLVGTYELRVAGEGPGGRDERTVVGDPTRGWRTEDPIDWSALYLEIDPALLATGKRWTVRVTRWLGDPNGLGQPLRLQPPREGRVLALRPVGRKDWPRMLVEEDGPPLRHPLHRLEYEGKPDHGEMPMMYFLLGDDGSDGQLRFVLERDGLPACELRVKTYSPSC